jgi:hypothetical protein
LGADAHSWEPQQLGTVIIVEDEVLILCVSDSHKVMIALILVVSVFVLLELMKWLPSKLIVEFPLQSER